LGFFYGSLDGFINLKAFEPMLRRTTMDILMPLLGCVLTGTTFYTFCVKPVLDKANLI
tara:strand:+ start:2839 stop:3012 length:174 start_codon:yes stop_codon:yes gene_type:complete